MREEVCMEVHFDSRWEMNSLVLAGWRPWLIICLLFLSAGCAHHYERVELPPKETLGGAKVIAVLPFENLSGDQGLGRQFEEEVLSVLQPYFKLIGSVETAARLKEAGIEIDHIRAPETTAKAAKYLQADAFLLGLATYYFEDVTQDVPRRVEAPRTGQPYWVVTQRTSAIVNFQGTVVAPDGTVLYGKLVIGQDDVNDSTTIDWQGAEPPPLVLIPGPSRHRIPALRTTAVRRALNQFATDILPRYVYQRRDS